MARPEVSYLKTKLTTARPEELTIITFDVLINSTAAAIAGLNNPVLDIEAIHKDLRRAQRAVALLMGSLRFEIDDELGRNIFRIYEYWHHELFMANMQKSSTTIEALLPDFKSYRQTWVEANRRYRAEQSVPLQYSEGGFVAVS